MTQVNFEDPFMRAAAMLAKGIGLCAFLILWAAVQRGLRVTFIYDAGIKYSRFSAKRSQGHRGEIFIISDGKKEHVFSRTMGDLNDPEKAKSSDNKYQAKLLLRNAGLNVPRGIMVTGKDYIGLREFLELRPHRRFAAKPLFGSLSSHVRVGLKSDEVECHLKCFGEGEFVIEELVRGREYRLTVVGDRCVAVSWRRKPCVVADGVSSVLDLITTLETGLRSNNPHWGGFHNRNEMISVLQRQGCELKDVLPCGKKNTVN